MKPPVRLALVNLVSRIISSEDLRLYSTFCGLTASLQARDGKNGRSNGRVRYVGDIIWGGGRLYSLGTLVPLDYCRGIHVLHVVLESVKQASLSHLA